jgi:glucose-6-phosphate isomerase
MIEVDFNNLMADKVGLQGLTDADIDKNRPRVIEAIENLNHERSAGERPYLDLPKQDVTEILDFVESKKGQFDNLLVLGIGGSALGATALRTALCEPFHNSLSASKRKGALKVFVADYIDPDYFTSLLKSLKAGKTLVNVISKSGATAETMSQFLIVRNWLEGKGLKLKDHVFFTTDPQKGTLRRLARELEIDTFAVPDGVGGRFSVFSAVGLLPAAFMGVDIKALLKGAEEMTERCLAPRLGTNPAATMALTHWLLDREKNKTISVWMPYAKKLWDVADWYRQLWAESLGKKENKMGQRVFNGQTPIRAMGITDQHSQIQLYVEGPNDKVITFLSVKRFGTRGRIPVGETDKSLGYLAGSNLQKLVEAERMGTEAALTRAERPSCHLLLPKISEEVIGALLQMTMIQTSLAGYLYNVDPYDQPGVEYGKIATFARMGRVGSEEDLRNMKPYLSRKSKYVCR